ncbi:MAG: dynamin family protein [Coleofasciculaceae cyanobacterium]
MNLHNSNDQLSISSFAEFQKWKEELSQQICNHLCKIFHECYQRGLSTDVLLTDIDELQKKLKSYQFRLSIIGEFSRGKSTLVNALVGEQIQPVRAIACSGAVTILKYGLTKRILCHYKNGQKKEVSFEEYQTLASISKEAARKHRSDELARSQIEEIIFEHPNLEFCQNGVEIVDSPGLNEHPDRAAITQKLLKHTDAVIFLTFASALLSETERELIYELKEQLSGGKQQEPARNLFIVVNKMDELESDEDRQDVKDSVEEFAGGEHPLLAGKNRIHFISAKAALDAKRNKNHNDYIDSFEEFTKSIEEFLTNERGNTELRKAVTKLEKIIEDGLVLLQILEENLDKTIKYEEAKKQDFIEKIGELCGHSIRIEFLTKKWITELEIPLRIQLNTSWENWISSSLSGDLKSNEWTYSDGNDLIFKQGEVVKNYTEQFKVNLLNAIIDWGHNNKEYVGKIIQVLDNRILNELNNITNFKISDINIEEIFSRQLPYDFKFEVDKKDGYGDFFAWIGTLFFVGRFFGSADSLSNQIKNEVFHKGMDNFKEKESEIFDKIYTTVPITFETRIKRVKEIIDQVIDSVQVDLDNQDKEYQKILLYCDAEKAFIAQKRQELEQVQKNLKTIIPA